MNLKDQKQIVVLNAPESFEGELSSLRGVTILRSLQDVKEVEFFLAFVTKQKEVDTIGKAVGKKKRKAMRSCGSRTPKELREI